MQTALRGSALFLGFGVIIATATAWHQDSQPPTPTVQPAPQPSPSPAPAAGSPQTAPVVAPTAATPPSTSAPAPAVPSDPTKELPKAVSPYVLAHRVNDIDGKEVNLEDYKGKVLLIVNVASKCGFTRQYSGLETIYKQYKDQGFVVLGFPSNDFGDQEPGTESQIKSFCTSKFGVTFPMFSKVSVTGANAHPLFQQLAKQPGSAGGEPKWNFNKYLIDRNGAAVIHVTSGVRPDDEGLVKLIQTALAAPAK